MLRYWHYPFPEPVNNRIFNRTAFHRQKKIFATLSEQDQTLNLKFTPAEHLSLPAGSDVIHPVAGGWGRQGWTTIHLSRATKSW